MKIFKCKMCAGNLNIEEFMTVCECEYCGTKQTVPKLDDERRANLYDRANHFRRNNDFDKAMEIYEQILSEDNSDSEAYWSIVLCRYGIEYVEDPTSHKRIPTVNRTQYTSIFQDADYLAAINNADFFQKGIYEEEAKAINTIQKGILEISKKEKPFDIFICYKETDNNGKRTPDSVLANELYHQLTQEGFKVFFSRITLEDKFGQEYEPYIFAALNSSQIMIVLGTKPEYFDAPWVKNEWSRFLALIHNDSKKMLIPAYKDMDPYDLPDAFSHLQALDMTKLGFMQDLIRGIKKIIRSENQLNVQKDFLGVTGNSGALIKRGNMALEDGEWQKADSFFEDVLNQDAECAEAYLGKLMAKLECSGIQVLKQMYISKYEIVETERLEACPEDVLHIEDAVATYMVEGYLPEIAISRLYRYDRTYMSVLSFRKQQKDHEIEELSNERLLSRAKAYAKGETKSLIDNMLQEITNVLDNRIAVAMKDDDEAINRIKRSYEMHIEDADKEAKDLYNKAIERQEAAYNSILANMDLAKTISDFEKIQARFMSLHNYKDTAILTEKCRDEIARLREEERIEADKLEALKKSELARKKRKIILTVSALFIVTVLSISIYALSINIFIPAITYSNANKLLNGGKYEEAIIKYKSLDGYKDTEKQLAKAETKCIADALVGDIVTFGNYNGSVEWKVLAKEDERVLILSNYALEQRCYNTDSIEVTWESCTLRTWLNESYLNAAFTSEEQDAILSATVINLSNSTYNTDGGNNTIDKVFLLSLEEVEKYFPSDTSRRAKMVESWDTEWWLRTPGYDGEYATFVSAKGYIITTGGEVNNIYRSVRPALWINIVD